MGEFMKTAIVVAAVGAASILVAGCEKKPTGQVVAVVNGEEITQQELNREVQGVSQTASADRKEVLPQVLEQLVARKLLAQKAREEGLDKTPEYLAQSRRLQEELLLKMMSDKRAKGIALPEAAKVNQFIASNPTLFQGRKRYTLDQVVFPSNVGPAILKQLEPTHSLDGVAAVLSANNIKFTRGSSGLDTAMVTSEVANRIASLPAGEPFILPANGQLVASVVKDIQLVPTAESEAKPAAIELLRRQSVDAALRGELDTARAGAKIEYKPGLEPKQAPKGGGTAK
jgi:peptidyl-prolyl cis-trans isomerase C